MIKLLRLVVIFLSISNISWAQDSTYLNAQDKAPFSGYLLPEQTVKNLRNDSLDLQMYKSIIPLKDAQNKLLTDQNTNLANTLEKTSSLSTWEKIGYFGAGVVLTGLAIKAAHEIYK